MGLTTVALFIPRVQTGADESRIGIRATGDEEETRSRGHKIHRILFQHNVSCLGGGNVHYLWPATWKQGFRGVRVTKERLGLLSCHSVGGPWGRGSRPAEGFLTPTRLWCRLHATKMKIWDSERQHVISHNSNKKCQREEESVSWRWLSRRCSLRRRQWSRLGQCALPGTWQQQLTGGQRYMWGCLRNQAPPCNVSFTEGRGWSPRIMC